MAGEVGVSGFQSSPSQQRADVCSSDRGSGFFFFNLGNKSMSLFAACALMWWS